MNFRGITAGTYIDRRQKNKKEKNICSNCDNYKNFKEKHIDKEKQYELCKNCTKCYVSKSYRATLTVSRDTTTGKVKRETFIGESKK